MLAPITKGINTSFCKATSIGIEDNTRTMYVNTRDIRVPI